MKIQKRIDLKQIIDSNLDSLQIFEYYFGKIDFNKVYHSPLRRDVNASLSFYIDKNGEPRAKDFATGDNPTAINFVKQLFNLTYPQALEKIASDFGLKDIDFKAEIVKKDYTKEIVAKKPAKIQIIPKKFSIEDIKFWESYGIQKQETLKLFNVYSVDKVYLNKQIVSKKKNELCFGYFFPHSNNIKVYFPERKKGEGRFISNTNNLMDLQGYYENSIKTKKPQLAIITSSLKECAFLYERNLVGLALHGENHYPDPDLIRHLKKYCSKLLTLMDFDDAGAKSAEFYKKEYNIDFIPKPDYLECNSKDVTDCWKFGNKEQVERFINEIKQGII